MALAELRAYVSSVLYLMGKAKTTREQCYIRDNWACRHCNNRNGITSHHVIYKSQQGPDDLNNRLTLCASCHRGHHDGKLLIEVLSVTEDNLVVKFTRVKGWKPS